MFTEFGLLYLVYNVSYITSGTPFTSIVFTGNISGIEKQKKVLFLLLLWQKTFPN